MRLPGFRPVLRPEWRAPARSAKSLLILMVLPFALLLPLVFRGGKPFVAHAVFALHVFAFLLLAFCVSLLICVTDELLGGAGLRSPRMDTVLSLLNLSACAVYLHLAMGEFYRSRGWLRVLQVLGLSLVVSAIVLGYRFLLFLITLYGT